ncbi:MAG: acyl-CoA thioesterase [Deltaproteobacteria bacterium]|jgi:acyl-CoA thioester hydrolase|nr:MAG: acyl-CoA thioesterase [Deltaproteobacteria bacterium]
MTEPDSNTIFSYGFIIPESSLDQNGHVNNVVYVQWMQDVAILHANATGGTRAMHAAGGTWVVHSHKVEYLSPAFANEEIVALTWVVNFRRVRSVRRYKFVRKKDNKLLARGETEWVFVDADNGHPRKIPDEVMRLFPVVEDDEEP